MMALARVISEHPHTVQRELLVHRFRWGEFGPSWGQPLALWEFISFALAAPQTTELGLALREGWSHTDHLIANLHEQNAHVIDLNGRYQRPGVKKTAAAPAAPEPATEQPEEERADPTAVAGEIARGAGYDRFESPADFEAKLKAFRARRFN
jgi:hypothetical protein